MAKKRQPTNAFGFTPDSFETAGIANEEVVQETAPVEPVIEQPAFQDTPVQVDKPVILIQTEKRETKDKHVHFLAKSSLIDELDACAAELGMKRTAVIEEAIKYFLSSTKKMV